MGEAPAIHEPGVALIHSEWLGQGRGKLPVLRLYAQGLIFYGSFTDSNKFGLLYGCWKADSCTAEDICLICEAKQGLDW